MSTISEVTNRHLAFQETQLLPLPTLEMMNRLDGATSPFAAPPHAESAPEMRHRPLAFNKTQLLPLLNPEVKAEPGGAGRTAAPETKPGFVGQILAARLKLSACCATVNVWRERLHG